MPMQDSLDSTYSIDGINDFESTKQYYRGWIIV